MAENKPKRFLSPRHWTLEQKLAYWTVAGPNGCLLWTGAKNRRGYAKLCWRGRQRMAHRYVFESKHGQIPSGMCVCHTCDTPSCINVDHLWLGTTQANTADKMAKGRGVSSPGEANGCARLTVEQVQDIRRSECSYAELAALYGVTEDNIHLIKRGKAWKHLPFPDGVEVKNRLRKLTEDAVREIRSDRRTQAKIAAEYGVSNSLIGMIRTRKVWRHVP